MEFTLDGKTVRYANGGRDHDSALPGVVMVHGSGMNRTVWQMQTRYLAHHGYRVAAIDLPGHGGSDGPPIETIPEMGAWVGQAAKPMLSATGGGLAVLRTAGSYVCRSRNNEQGAQLSEHAFGRAIDITAFGLRDGREVSLTSGWNSRANQDSGAGGPSGMANRSL